MIIALNGYIGSGKDTIGYMIQYMDSVSKGYKGDFYDWYMTSDRSLYPSSWQIKKFAGKLKQIASLLTGIPVEKFEDQEFKKSSLGKEWDNMTVREFLQKLGTEGIRTGLHTNAWVNALFADYKPDYEEDNYDHVEATYFPNWLITDCRFPNEAEAVKKRGGVVIRINRGYGPEYKTLEKYNKEKHPSETSLDDWKFDYVIENDGSVVDLMVKVNNMMKVIISKVNQVNLV